MFGAARGTGRGLQGPGLLVGGGGSGQGTAPGQAGGSHCFLREADAGQQRRGGWAGVGGEHVCRGNASGLQDTASWGGVVLWGW